MSSDARTRRSGFTLIELLVVTAILGVVIVAIGACLAGGLRVWDVAQRFNVTEADVATAFELIQRDLRGTAPLYDSRFEGCEERLTIPTTVIGGEDQAYQLGTVVYRYDAHGQTLRREEHAQDGTRVRAEVLVQGVLQWRVRFPAAAAEALVEGCTSNLHRQVSLLLQVQEDSGPVSFLRDVYVRTGTQP